MLRLFGFSACDVFLLINGGESLAPYGNLWQELNRFYLKCIKCALGLHQSTSEMAVLVVAGIWPLDFHLAYQSASWLYKIHNNLGCDALHDQYKAIQQNQSEWNASIFYKPATDFLKTVSLPTEDLLDLPSLFMFKRTLKMRIHTTLDDLWTKYPKAKFTKSILPKWPINSPSSHMYSKTGSVRQLRMTSGHFESRAYLFACKRAETDKCRHGCDQSETAEHILLHCSFYKKHRVQLLEALAQHNLEPTVANILTNSKVLPSTQRLLHNIGFG